MVQPSTSTGIAVEPVQEHLVVRIEQLREKAVERLARRGHFLAVHAAARVEHNAEADRHPLAVEVRDGLRLVVLVDAEVFLPQTRDEAAGAGR